MKKFLKWIAIIIGSLIGLLIILAILLPFILPLDAIKDYAVTKMEEELGQKVVLEKVSFNIFSGIKLQNLQIGNPTVYFKKAPISVKTAELRYSFWSLFSGKLIINKIALIELQITIEKDASGETNLSKLFKKKPKKEKIKEEEKKAPLSLLVNTFTLKRGELNNVDLSTKPAQITQIKELSVDVSGIVLSAVSPISAKASATAVYKGAPIPVSASAKIFYAMEKEKVNITAAHLSVAGEKANISAVVSNFFKGPAIDFSLSSNKLSAETFLGILAAGSSAKTKAAPGELTKNLNRSLQNIKSTLSLNGKINIDNLTYKTLKIDKISLNVSMRNKVVSLSVPEISAYGGKLEAAATANLNILGISYQISKLSISNFNAHPFINAMVDSFLTMKDKDDMKDKLYGTLDFKASGGGRGVEGQDILANAKFSGSFSLSNGELKHFPVLESFADKINQPDLKKDFKLDTLSTAFALKNKILTLTKLVADSEKSGGDIKVQFDGGLNLGNLNFVSGNNLKVTLLPNAAKNLPKEYEMLKDKDGSASLDFEMQGSLKRPIPVPKIEKAVEKVLEKATEKIKERLNQESERVKKEAEEAAKKEAEKATEDLKKKGAEELKKLLKL